MKQYKKVLDFTVTDKYNIFVVTKKKGVDNMSPRTGRPKSDNPKSHDIKIRIDDMTYDELMKYCDKNKITKTEATRLGLEKLLGIK